MEILQPLCKDPMLSYADLSRRYAEYYDARHGYWRDLQKCVRQLAQALEHSLELTCRMWTDAQGQTHPYVEIGQAVGERFEALPAEHLAGDEASGILPFLIRLTLEMKPDVHPKSQWAQVCNISARGQHVEVALEGAAPVVFSVPREAIAGRFADVCEAIKRRLYDHLEPQQFGFKK